MSVLCISTGPEKHKRKQGSVKGNIVLEITDAGSVISFNTASVCVSHLIGGCVVMLPDHLNPV